MFINIWIPSLKGIKKKIKKCVTITDFSNNKKLTSIARCLFLVSRLSVRDLCTMAYCFVKFCSPATDLMRSRISWLSCFRESSTESRNIACLQLINFSNIPVALTDDNFGMNTDIRQRGAEADCLIKFEVCLCQKLPTVNNYLVEVTDIRQIKMCMQFNWFELPSGNKHIILCYCVNILWPITP